VVSGSILCLLVSLKGQKIEWDWHWFLFCSLEINRDYCLYEFVYTSVVFWNLELLVIIGKIENWYVIVK